jgi:branched-subunit amino acid transport protein AzlD
MTEHPALTEAERAELERLRNEVATLRSQVQQDGVAGQGRSAAVGRVARQRWRTIVATLLIVVACVLAPLSVVAVWTRNQVTNTDRYVQTVAPLASDPAIQNAIADQITAQVFTYIDIRGLTTQAVEALASRGLSPEVADQLQAFAVPIANGVQSFTRSQVGKVVESDAFADAWLQANRVAHDELVQALTGEGGGAVTVENDTVSLDLAAFIQTVKQRLVEGGFTVAARIPEVNASFVLFQSEDITRARSAFNLLNTLGVWLPIIVLILLVVGVYVAKDHRRALVGAGVGIAVGMVVLALALTVFRAVYLDAVPAEVLPHDAAAVLYDTIVRFLRAGLRTVLVLGLVVAAGAFLTGKSVTAVRTRQGLTSAIGWLQGSSERAGLRTGPVGTWVYGHKRALRIGAVALASLALVFWGRPTGKVVLGLALALLVALAIIEFLGRPPQRTAEVSTSHT